MLYIDVHWHWKIQGQCFKKEATIIPLLQIYMCMHIFIGLEEQPKFSGVTGFRVF